MFKKSLMVLMAAGLLATGVSCSKSQEALEAGKVVSSVKDVNSLLAYVPDDATAVFSVTGDEELQKIYTKRMNDAKAAIADMFEVKLDDADTLEQTKLIYATVNAALDHIDDIAALKDGKGLADIKEKVNYEAKTAPKDWELNDETMLKFSKDIAAKIGLGTEPEAVGFLKNKDVVFIIKTKDSKKFISFLKAVVAYSKIDFSYFMPDITEKSVTEDALSYETKIGDTKIRIEVKADGKRVTILGSWDKSSQIDQYLEKADNQLQSDKLGGLTKDTAGFTYINIAKLYDTINEMDGSREDKACSHSLHGLMTKIPSVTFSARTSEKMFGFKAFVNVSDPDLIKGINALSAEKIPTIISKTDLGSAIVNLNVSSTIELAKKVIPELLVVADTCHVRSVKRKLEGISDMVDSEETVSVVGGWTSVSFALRDLSNDIKKMKMNFALSATGDNLVVKATKIASKLSPDLANKIKNGIIEDIELPNDMTVNASLSDTEFVAVTSEADINKEASLKNSEANGIFRIVATDAMYTKFMENTRKSRMESYEWSVKWDVQRDVSEANAELISQGKGMTDEEKEAKIKAEVDRRVAEKFPEGKEEHLPMGITNAVFKVDSNANGVSAEFLVFLK